MRCCTLASTCLSQPRDNGPLPSPTGGLSSDTPPHLPPPLPLAVTLPSPPASRSSQFGCPAACSSTLEARFEISVFKAFCRPSALKLEKIPMCPHFRAHPDMWSIHRCAPYYHHTHTPWGTEIAAENEVRKQKKLCCAELVMVTTQRQMHIHAPLPCYDAHKGCGDMHHHTQNSQQPAPEQLPLKSGCVSHTLVPGVNMVVASGSISWKVFQSVLPK